MAIPVFADDLELADGVLGRVNLLTAQEQLRDAIALAIATERERCAKIAEAIDSNRGNEKEIAKAIRDPRRQDCKGTGA